MEKTARIFRYASVVMALIVYTVTHSQGKIYAHTVDSQKTNQYVYNNDSEPIMEMSPSNEDDANLLRDVFSFKAQLKDVFTYAKTDMYSRTGTSKQLVANLTRIRLSPEWNISDDLLVHVDFDNECITDNYGKSSEFSQMWGIQQYNDLFHLSKNMVDTDTFLYRTKLHQAFVKYLIGDLTLTAGRQQIHFGSARLWNPLDILNPVSPMSIEGGEEQKGADVLRAEYYLNQSTELSVIYNQERKNDNLSSMDRDGSNVLCRMKTSAGNSAIAALAGVVSRRVVTCLDISSIAYDGKIYASVTYSKPERVNYGKSFFQSNAGYEYNFSFGLYFLFECFFNQDCLNTDANLMDIYAQNAFFGVTDFNHTVLSNRIITYNQYYSGLALGYDITPLLKTELLTINDYQGRSIFVNPTFKYNLYENVDLSLGVMKSFKVMHSDKISDFENVRTNPLIYLFCIWYF